MQEFLLRRSRMLKLRHVILGTTGWLTVIISVCLSTHSRLAQQSASLTKLSGDLRGWITGARNVEQAKTSVPLRIALHDPVFVATTNDRFIQAGYVSNIDGTRAHNPKYVQSAEIVIYHSVLAQFPDGCHLEYYTTPMNLDQVITTMIPPERRVEIAAMVRSEWGVHENIVLEQLEPVVKEGMNRAIRAVEAELPGIISNYQKDFQHLSTRFQAEILTRQLIPIVREEILPIIKEESQPLAMEIGRSLWNRVSLTSFALRYLYDVSPLPERSAVRTEFERFIEREAVPELEARTDELIGVTRQIIKRVMENESVRSKVRDTIQHIMEDPEASRVLGVIVRKATIENTVLHSELKQYWNSRQTRTALRVTSDRLEPMVRSIGDLIFGNREKGITAEFSRVLRSQILRKDRRWFVIVPDNLSNQPGSIEIRVAGKPMQYPLRFFGQQQSPLTPESQRFDSSSSPEVRGASM